RCTDAELTDKAGLTENKINRRKPETILEVAANPGVSSAIQPHRSRAPRHCDTVSGSRRFNEVTMPMSFLAGWIEPPHAGLNCNLTNRIAVTFRTYNPEE
ncbi:MAG TPA: hypothetical protein VNO32_41555, partial [Candidatus Acidoferrum sp.]|nr:hypothetical protein [Candidatus Acidoferrum sp.]